MQHIRSWRHLINIACFTRATVRHITLTRSTRDDVLNFNILGGTDTSNNGIFVSKVEKDSKAYEAGLRRGDQVSLQCQKGKYLRLRLIRKQYRLFVRTRQFVVLIKIYKI